MSEEEIQIAILRESRRQWHQHRRRHPSKVIISVAFDNCRNEILKRLKAGTVVSEPAVTELRPSAAGTVWDCS
ncbi:hypothetical protein E2C01_089348 [Portunus trituberculatus]|uniref:Uncharacterized protein n=1 Tax=Portunus trituberculatus TaxID=210409 RepID=A0A5B7JDA9_PORTR|nr:hypothetical protein [Portunus trituberculatus]